MKISKDLTIALLVSLQGLQKGIALANKPLPPFKRSVHIQLIVTYSIA